MAGPLLIITVHRGAQEIGGNCIELKTATSRLILDVGMPSSEMSDDGGPRKRKPTLHSLIRRGVIKPIPGLFAPGPEIDGILLSHAHLGHAGLVEYTLPETPVYLSSATNKMLHARYCFTGEGGLPRDRQNVLEPGKRRRIGDFFVTPYLVDHSCYGSMAFLIEAKGKRIAYSGDLRQHGRHPQMTKNFLKAISKAPLDILMLEGTNLDRGGKLILSGPSEADVERRLVETLTQTPGLCLALVPPQNVDCLESYYRAAVRTRRTLVLDPYSAYVMHLVKTESNTSNSFKNNHLRTVISKNFDRSFAGRSLPELLLRMREVKVSLTDIFDEPGKFLMLCHDWKQIQTLEKILLAGSGFIYSYGYRYQTWLTDLFARLKKSGCSFRTIQASGHFYYGDLCRFIKRAKPRQLLPIHTTGAREMIPILVISLKTGQAHYVVEDRR